MSRLIQRSEESAEDLMVEAARLFDELSEGGKEGANAHEDGPTVVAVLAHFEAKAPLKAMQLIVDRPECVNGTLSDEEVDTMLGLLVRASPALEAADREALFAHLLAQWWPEGKTQGNPLVRLQLLSNLFNLASMSKSVHRAAILLRWLSLAGEVHKDALIAAQAPHAAEWMTECDMTAAQKKAFVVVMVHALVRCHELREAAVWWTRYLVLLHDSAADVTAEDRANVQRATAALIMLPGLLPTSVDEAAHKVMDAHAKDLHDLLVLVLDGSVSALENHHKAHAALYDTHQVEYAAILRRLQLRAVGHALDADGTLGYAALAGVIGVAEDAVEDWVLDVLGDGILDARLNPVTKTVTILALAHRSYAAPECASLKTKLASWKDVLPTDQ